MNKNYFELVEMPVLFRASAVKELKTQPRGKTPKQKYEAALEDAIKAGATYAEKVAELSKLKEGTKAYESKQGVIAKALQKWEVKKAAAEELEKQKDAVFLSETTKKKLDEMAIEIHTGRTKEIENQYTRHGKDAEPESKEMYSDWSGEDFTKIEERRMFNDCFTGLRDLTKRNKAGAVRKVIDIKSRYSVFTFYKHVNPEVSLEENGDQLNIYCDIEGEHCTEAEIANVLTNRQPKEVNRILYNEASKFEDPDNPDAVMDLPLWRKIQVLKDHIFDRETLDKYIDGEYMDERAKAEYDSFVDIPLERRVIPVAVKRDQESIDETRALVPLWRQYLYETWNIKHVENELATLD